MKIEVKMKLKYFKFLFLKIDTVINVYLQLILFFVLNTVVYFKVLLSTFYQ